jgi:hypothetical protein
MSPIAMTCSSELVIANSTHSTQRQWRSSSPVLHCFENSSMTDKLLALG